MTRDSNFSEKSSLRDPLFEVLGGALKNIHENGIAMVDYFGVRSKEEDFTLGDLRTALGFYLRQQTGMPPPGPIEVLPSMQEAAFQDLCAELIEQRLLKPVTSDYLGGRFRVQLLPAPFDLKWRFVRQLDGGGQSQTFVVRESKSKQGGVLKVLPSMSPGSSRDVAIDRFRREVETLLKINHPAIVKLLDHQIDETAGALGYVTPLGVPLEVYWNERAKGIDPAALYSRAYEIICSIAEGLATVHRLGLVHRDLKPDNVVMFGDQPVVIDFGLVTNAKYQAQHLTPVDGRQVGNDFNPVAVYGLDDADPRRDIAGLGWLYGFLLGVPVGGKRRPQRFHWQYHNMVAEPRENGARAILAACSLRDSIPQNVEAFRAMIERYWLDGSKLRLSTKSEPPLAEVERTHAENLAREMLLGAEEKERFELGQQLFAGPLTALRSELVRRCVGSTGVPISQWDQSDEDEDSFLTTPAPQAPMTTMLKMVFHQVAQGIGNTDSSVVPLFWCVCGDRLRFKVSVCITYSRKRNEDTLDFSLELDSADLFGERRRWHETSYSFHSDGQFRRTSDGLVTTVDQIAEEARAWCHENSHWEQLKRP
jgi:hypothetical protein